MADPPRTPPLTRASVIEAHELIKPYIHLTPVVTSTTLSNLASSPRTTTNECIAQDSAPARPKIRLFFKCENQQRVGAFKARGAFHALARLSPEERRRGVITHSSGAGPSSRRGQRISYPHVKNHAARQVTMRKPWRWLRALTMSRRTLSCRPSRCRRRLQRRKAMGQK